MKIWLLGEQLPLRVFYLMMNIKMPLYKKLQEEVDEIAKRLDFAKVGEGSHKLIEQLAVKADVLIYVKDDLESLKALAKNSEQLLNH